MTKGQFTPTSPSGFEGTSTPQGSPEDPLNPIELMLCAGATFVARGFSTNMKHLRFLLKAAVKHNGFPFIDVPQPCVSFFDNGDYYSEHTLEKTLLGVTVEVRPGPGSCQNRLHNRSSVFENRVYMTTTSVTTHPPIHLAEAGSSNPIYRKILYKSHRYW